MERPDYNQHNDGDTTVPTPLADGSKPKKTVEENTGLFDIRTLANLQKKRITERMSSESDVEEALLASASASALATIALPEPGTEIEPFALSTFGSVDMPLPEAPAPAQAKAKAPAKAPSAPVQTRTLPAAAAIAKAAVTHPLEAQTFGSSVSVQKPKPMWPFALVGAVVVAGVAGFFVLRGAGTETEAPVATATEEAPSPAAAPSVEPLAEPVAQPLEEEKPEEAAAEPAAADEPEIEPDTGAMVDDKDKPKAKPEATERKNYKRAKKESPDESNDDALRAAIEERKVKKATDEPKKVVDTSDTKKDIDELLDQAAVGTALAPKKAEEDKKPTRTEVSRSDVKSAMGAITAKAKGCYNLYEQEGTVQIRFTVEPSGKISKAGAVGKFKGSDTGKCVATAVQGATFPAFDGAPTTFTYPFLLSP